MSFGSGLSSRGLVVGLLCAVLTVTGVLGEPAVAESSRVRAGFFGMHDFNPTSWPAAPVGAIRLWDSGVSWREIERRRGEFDFSRLDSQVDAARAHGAQVLLVLGQTPRFYASRPGQPASYGSGAASMPSRRAWKRYVYTVVKRYKGRGLDYQVWNEANVEGYWKGTPAQMAKLTRWAAQVIHRNDSAAKVVAPALATRLSSQRKWLRTFYAQRVGGSRVAAFVDVVALNLYPLAGDPPEASMTLLAASRTMLRALGVRKPIWNTEINYGLLGGGVARDIARKKEAAFVARTFTLNAANGVNRVFWYTWDLQKLANTQLTQPDGQALTRAGVAYAVAHGWLLGARIQGCPRDGRGTYTCTLRYSGGVKRIYWNPSRTVSVRTHTSATRRVSLAGFSTDLDGGETLRVGSSPIMVRSRR